MPGRRTIHRIKDAAAQNRLRLRYHALSRAEERGIYYEHIRHALLDGEVIERHEAARPYPKYLFLSDTRDGIPFYVSVGYDEDHDLVHVVTVHWQDPERWIDDRTRRRKPKA